MLAATFQQRLFAKNRMLQTKPLDCAGGGMIAQ
jgi:hypothetical protein